MFWFGFSVDWVLGGIVLWVGLCFGMVALGFGVCVLDGLIWYNVFWVYVLGLGVLGLGCFWVGFYLLFWFWVLDDGWWVLFDWFYVMGVDL